jgi:hypothetical protein
MLNSRPGTVQQKARVSSRLKNNVYSEIEYGI